MKIINWTKGECLATVRFTEKKIKQLAEDPDKTNIGDLIPAYRVLRK